jgi:hypothetical protein
MRLRRDRRGGVLADQDEHQDPGDQGGSGGHQPGRVQSVGEPGRRADEPAGHRGVPGHAGVLPVPDREAGGVGTVCWDGVERIESEPLLRNVKQIGTVR